MTETEKNFDRMVFDIGALFIIIKTVCSRLQSALSFVGAKVSCLVFMASTAKICLWLCNVALWYQPLKNSEMIQMMKQYSDYLNF